MARWHRLDEKQERGLERWFRLEHACWRAEIAASLAAAQARIAHHMAEKLRNDTRAIETRANFLRREADSIEAWIRAARSSRFLRFRLIRLIRTWRPET